MSGSTKRTRPAIQPENREGQLISKAIALAERQLEEGTASSQVISHFLKLGSMREQLEMEKLRNENEVLKAKAENLHSMKRVEELYSKALSAMRNYAGQGDPDDYYD